MEKENKFVSLVVYLHESESEIETFLNSVVLSMQKRFAQVELVCVDDCCTDRTISLIKEFCKKDLPHTVINILHMSYYQGLESAMNAGRDLAIGDFVFEFDSALVDYEISAMDEVYEKMLEGYDVVSARSSVKPSFTSRLFYYVFNKYAREKSSLLGNDSFRLISRRAINRAKSIGTFIPYRKAVYASSGLKLASVVYQSTTGKAHKTTSFSRVEFAVDSFVYFTIFLEKVSAFLSGAFLLATVAIALYSLSDLIFDHETADGWLSLMGFLSIGFFGMFLLLTIVLKYLSILLNAVFRRKEYLIEDIEKIVPEETL